MKKLLSVLFIINLSFSTYGWSQKFDWATVEGGSNGDTVDDIIVDNDGNTYVACYMSRPQFQVNDIPGKINIKAPLAHVLVKYNPKGKILWYKEIVMGGGPVVLSLCLDNSGNIYLAGMCASLKFGVITFNPNYNPNDNTPNKIIVAKFSISGDLIWLKVGGGTLGNGVSKITMDKEQNVCITGNSYGVFSFGGSVFPTSKDGYYTYIAKLTGEGKAIDIRRLFGNCNGEDIKFNENGECYLLGSVTGSLVEEKSDKNFKSGPLNSSFICKYDQKGNIIWFKSIEPGQYTPSTFPNADARSLEIDKMGFIYVYGLYNSQLIFNEGNSINQIILPIESKQNAFYSKFNSDGKHIWSKKATLNNGSGDLIDNHYNRIPFAVDSLGNIFLGGRTSSNVLEGKPIPDGKRDFIVAKYNVGGQLEWMQGITIPKPMYRDGVRKIALTNTGKVLVAGEFYEEYSIPELNQFGKSQTKTIYDPRTYSYSTGDLLIFSTLPN